MRSHRCKGKSGHPKIKSNFSQRKEIQEKDKGENIILKTKGQKSSQSKEETSLAVLSEHQGLCPEGLRVGIEVVGAEPNGALGKRQLHPINLLRGQCKVSFVNGF